MSIPATPAKLRSGAWGARVKSASVTEGDIVTITTRSGKTWDAVVEAVLWTGDGVSLCATSSLDRAPSRGGYPRGRGWWTGCRCGSREDEFGDLIPSAGDCRSCERDG